MLRSKFIRSGLALIISVIFLGSCVKPNPGIPEPPAQAKVTKILAIGNSFSEDAIESNLYELANAAGKKVIIGNMYIGGASLDLHVQNANNNAANYEYRKVDSLGVKTNTGGQSILTVLNDENWDYISFQQVSQNSGQYNTFETSLPALYNYVKAHVTNTSVKYILHQTWAYAQNSTHFGFVNYNNDQMTMYNAIVNAYNSAKSLVPNSMIVPSGTAIQNVRSSSIGDNLTRDGYHLSIPLGRYTAACTWYESIFEKSVVGNSFAPSELSAFEVSVAQNAAHNAVQTPGSVTSMATFK